MKKTVYVSGVLLSIAITIAACTDVKEIGDTKLNRLEPQLPEQSYDYAHIDRPSHVPGDFIQIENNKATLGRVLFYDNMLSINNSVACASCHLQQFAFSDGKSISRGVTSAHTERNSMAIMNTDRNNGLFWDLRESDLFSMVLKPIQNHVEMGFDKMDNVVANIQQTAYYKPLFEKAFGSSEVTAEKISVALTQFLSSMKSHNSKFDIGMQNDFANFNSQELLGKQLMMEKLHCGSCHSGVDFSGTWQTSANIGLEMEYKDKGIGGLPNNINGAPQDAMEGWFKIPSLRNIELTAPYMHDGRFKTLEEVIEHYNSGVQNHPNLDWHLKFIIDPNTGMPIGNGETALKLNLTVQEKAALVAFLKTLTDYSFTQNEMYSNPFRVVN